MAPGLEESLHTADEITAEDAAKDEEFKLIYHQTYKGAALALVCGTTDCLEILVDKHLEKTHDREAVARPDRSYA